MKIIKNVNLLLKCIIISIILIIPFKSAFSQSLATNYFVDAQKGNDANNGLSVEKPFKTISKAKDAVRFLDKSGSNNITVNLRGGTYFQAQTLEFKEKDGGTADCKIIYKNYKDEVPVISGGKLITGWKLFDKAKNIYRAPSNSLEFRQLYVNGIRAIRAKNPNNTNSDKDRYQVVRWNVNKKIVTINKSEIANWKNMTRVEFCTMSHFTGNHLRIASYTTDSSYAYLTFKTPEINVINGVEENFRTSGYGYNGLVGFWFENAYEFIDMEGEWYLNTADNYVYYKPRSGESMSSVDVIAPYLETIVKIEGSSLDMPVRHLQFHGIDFSYATWLLPNSNGCVEFQAFHPFSNTQDSITSCNYFTAPAGVYVAKADYIRFEQCTFTHMGANGLNLHYGTHNCSITGNVVNDISGNGINEARPNVENIGWAPAYFPSDSREICSNDTISNNYITNCGADYIGSVGIFCGFTKKVTIAHNEVCNLPYTGISVGWGWGGLKDTTVMSDNKINYNYIHDVMLIANDGGGIYTLGDQPNSLCNNNYCVSRSRGLYFDEGTGHYSISNNVVDADDEWITFWTDRHHDDIAYHNFTNTLKNMDVGTNCVIRNTVYVPDRNWPAEAKEIIKNAGLEDSYKDIKDKLKPKNQRINLNTKSGE